MTIEDAKYLQDIVDGTNSSVKCTIDGVLYHIPMDPGNRHYQEILAQVAASEITIADAD